ncbi:hypothetical protein D3C86_2104340 [compost metagenome]
MARCKIDRRDGLLRALPVQLRICPEWGEVSGRRDLGDEGLEGRMPVSEQASAVQLARGKDHAGYGILEVPVGPL